MRRLLKTIQASHLSSLEVKGAVTEEVVEIYTKLMGYTFPEGIPKA